MPSILIVDDERSIRTMLSDYFADRYEVVCAENGVQALDLLAKRKIDLVISDISMPEMNGIELLCAVRERHPTVKCALLTGNNIDHFITSDKKEYIGNIIPKTAPFNFAELEAIARGLITGDIFGLKRYLLADGTILAQYKITSSDDGRSVRKKAIGLFIERFGSAGDMELVLDEIITNAVYHAPSTDSGDDKYPSYSKITLKPG